MSHGSTTTEHLGLDVDKTYFGDHLFDIHNLHQMPSFAYNRYLFKQYFEIVDCSSAGLLSD